jgi:hypothetical protein
MKRQKNKKTLEPKEIKSWQDQLNECLNNSEAPDRNWKKEIDFWSELFDYLERMSCTIELDIEDCQYFILNLPDNEHKKYNIMLHLLKWSADNGRLTVFNKKDKNSFILGFDEPSDR